MPFPEERALFAVDFVSARRLPFRNLSDSYYPDWIDSLRRVERQIQELAALDLG